MPPSRPSLRIDDGLALTGIRITAPVHCAPPANKPTPDELHTCAPYLDRELELLAPTVRVAHDARRHRLAGAAAGTRRRGLADSAATAASSGTARRSSSPTPTVGG